MSFREAVRRTEEVCVCVRRSRPTNKEELVQRSFEHCFFFFSPNDTSYKLTCPPPPSPPPTPKKKPSSEGCDYAALLFPQRPSPHQDRPVPVDWSRLCHQNSQDDAPPVTGDPNTCAAVTPGSQSLRFYPILPEYPLAATSCTASVMYLFI